jgi:hypothetical protein
MNVPFFFPLEEKRSTCCFFRSATQWSRGRFQYECHDDEHGSILSLVQIRVGYYGPRSRRLPLALTVKHLIAWGGPKYPILRKRSCNGAECY